MENFIQTLPYTVPSVLICIVLHEWAHGFISYKFGDPTAKLEGRLSLNPLKHLDPLGTLCLMFFHFGWAKPVPINPNYYKDPKIGTLYVSLAGPCMNVILAFVSLCINELIYIFQYSFPYSIALYVFQLTYYIAIMSIGLAIFNLIPIPPLDGSKILISLLPDNVGYMFYKYERYLGFILIFLMMSGVFSSYLGYLSEAMFNGLYTVVHFIF